jgi:GNAT superfamily N-acetyltransferase
MTFGPLVRRASLLDAAMIVHVIANAVDSLDVCRWLVPDPDERGSIFRDYVAIITDHALTYGTVELTTNLDAAAVWLSCPFPEPVRYDMRLATACGRWTPRFHALDAALRDAHPTGRGEHDHLAFLAVDPDLHGHGLGTALLRHHLAALASQHRPAYLTASSPASRKLYELHGFTDCADPLDLPDGGERMQPMWWQPATATTTEAQVAGNAGHRSPSGPRRVAPSPPHPQPGPARAEDPAHQPSAVRRT